MDSAEIEEIVRKETELHALNANANALAARAAAYNAEVLVYGRAEAKRAGTTVVMGHTLQNWDITLNVRVIEADSAELLVQKNFRPQRAEPTMANAGGDKAFASLAEEVADQVLYEVGEAWRKRLTDHRRMRVFIDGCSPAEFNTLIAPALASIRGVDPQNGVKGRNMVNNTVDAEIEWHYDISALAAAIAELKVEGMAFEVTRQHTNRLECKVIRTP
jgi:hypothetical protein